MAVLLLATGTALWSFVPRENVESENEISVCYEHKGCVFRTIFGEEASDSNFTHTTSEEVQLSLDRGLQWISKAQLADGGWGAGSHSAQHVMDPHAVNADPATTAMVAMALLRTGTTLHEGQYTRQLETATEFLLRAVETTPQDRIKITEESGTQIQSKLGNNIDAVLTLQYLSNLYELLEKDSPFGKRVEDAMTSCANKIQMAQQDNGSLAGAGWAGVLQSALANNALEQVAAQEITVDRKKLSKAREYQKGNFNASSGAVDASDGAGVVLYSVSGSVRASAKDARKVKERIQEAKEEGNWADGDTVSAEKLEELGFTNDEAIRYSTSYQVYESAKAQAQRDEVISGFGNDGGEEFLSFLQTGESLIINKDETWKQWYDQTSGRLLQIQNNDGSWNGHHCITSPVFCTATTLLILSINNDVERLLALGEKE